MPPHAETFLAALGNSLMDLSGMTAENQPDAIADALVAGGGADAYGIGSAAGLTSAQTAAVLFALANGGTLDGSPLVHVPRGSAKVALLMPGARWYINRILGIPPRLSETGPIVAAGE